MKRLFVYPFKLVLSTLILLLLLTAMVLIVGGLKIAFYEQKTDEEHLDQKQTYLDTIAAVTESNTTRRPNIVFVLYDDLGYGDFSFTGSASINTPNIDRLAQNGVALKQFYSPAPVCTPARFGYLTGRVAERGALSHVVFPEGHLMDRLLRLRNANVGIPPSEISLANVLQAAGYKTGLVGKWHLGDQQASLPNSMGFEHFYGALYSNDMTPFALYKNRDVIIPAPVDQTHLSRHYVEATSEFIQTNKDRPFFLYLAHNFPHIPLFVRKDKLGVSGGGLYGDVVEELDDGIGQLIAALKAAGVYDNTLIIITSDNGPWFQGSPGGSRGRKAETFEGGMHVPFVAHWPQGFCRGCELDGLASGVDLMPTILDILKLPAPKDRTLDGRSLLEFLRNEADSPHDYQYYFSGKLLAVRDARFKYIPKRPIIHPMAGVPIAFGMPKGPWLFDLKNDPEESYDVSARYPEEFLRLEAAFKKKEDDMRENPAAWRKAN